MEYLQYTVNTPCTTFVNTVVFWLINTFYDFVSPKTTKIIFLTGVHWNMEFTNNQV